VPETNEVPKKRRRYASALLAMVPATLLAAIPLAAGVEGRVHRPNTCEGGICVLSELYLYATPVVWVGAWIVFSLAIAGFRKLAAVSDERRRVGRSGSDAT
jgi:hypothetical protein